MQTNKLELNGKRILLAEDEPGIRKVFRILLERLGLEVTDAMDGECALAFYRREKFDFVLTDYNMPLMRGDALARAIKDINPLQRIVMISGFAESLLQHGQLPSFIDALLPKPCTLRQLSEALA